MDTDYLANARHFLEEVGDITTVEQELAYATAAALVDIAASLRALGAVADSLRAMAISQEAI
ncbi:hypothetical protein [Mycolicibacterium mageritense]|uniref:hypothetical protein n=1 Tax=Mycolicibacterium mageritense TaxID=53462 RepID=UPI001E537EE9|nr:hypothetical protein [Mycolicibacterium mageritense]GJJ21093.1 hypothetical protein MTY414_47660 [Mycolicibacterium mageritense]